MVIFHSDVSNTASNWESGKVGKSRNGKESFKNIGDVVYKNCEVQVLTRGGYHPQIVLIAGSMLLYNTRLG
jgi:hypothetical protein